MKQNILRSLLALSLIFTGAHSIKAQYTPSETEKSIFVFGGDINLKFVEYVIDLTKKGNPKICYLPTASADNENNIKFWENICNTLSIEPIIMKVWVSSSEKNRSFEDILLSSDAIVVGGGNTLNMLGIWKAQGIDTILIKALEKGIILAGGSAGSICWFQNGISDSRPVNLSIVEGLSILPYSNCPHYSQEDRKEIYHQMIKEKRMPSGYANDDLAGILFKNGEAVEFVSQSDKHNSYFVSFEKGSVKSTKIQSKILLRKNALPENTYNSLAIKKKITNLLDLNDKTEPLNSYISEMKALFLDKESISESERNRVANISIEKIFIYENKLAGVVNNAYLNLFGYAIWYFYNCNGIWKSMGEDIGGETVFESEIVFREKAEIILKQTEIKLECK